MSDNRIPFDEMPALLLELINKVNALTRTLHEMRSEVSEQKVVVQEDKHVPITLDEVSRLTNKAKGTIYRLTCHNQIPCYKQGRNLVFFKDEILDWLQEDKKVYYRDYLKIADNCPSPFSKNEKPLDRVMR